MKNREIKRGWLLSKLQHALMKYIPHHEIEKIKGKINLFTFSSTINV